MGKIDTFKTMGRIIAFDYGTKRIGIAVTDSAKIIATPLGAQHPEKIMAWLATYVPANGVEAFVVGYPRQMSGEDSETAQHVRGFVKKLKRAFDGVPVHTVDERFTSIMAGRAMHAMGVGRKQKQDKETIDAVAATIILQYYMELHGI